MTNARSIHHDGNTAVLDAEESQSPAAVLKAEQTPAPHHKCGYGACSISGCYCQSYSGQAYTCANCGHNYASHW
jgi:hypothetical protein